MNSLTISNRITCLTKTHLKDLINSEAIVAHALENLCSMTKDRSEAWKGIVEAIYGSPSHKIFDADGPSATPAF